MTLRPKGYFMPYKEEDFLIYEEMMGYINEKEFTKIGIVMGENDYEYPIWKMLEGNDIRIEHVEVTNESKRYIDDSFKPECIIVLTDLVQELEYNYDKVLEFPNNRYLLKRK